MDLLKVTVKHRNGESKVVSNKNCNYFKHVEGYSENGMREEQQLQMREFFEERIVNNQRRSKSALPLGNHEQFHRRIHPDHPQTRPFDLTTDSFPEAAFMSPMNRYQPNDLLLPKLARNTTAVCPGPPQPPKVAFMDTTVGANSDEHNIILPCSHLLSFCHYCGRSSGIRLAWCLHCQNTVYCSQSCRQSHWDEGHKTECTDPNSFKTHKRCEYQLNPYKGILLNMYLAHVETDRVVFLLCLYFHYIFSIVFLISLQIYKNNFSFLTIAISLKTSRVTKVTNTTKGSRTRPKSVPANSQLPYISNTRTHQRR